MVLTHRFSPPYPLHAPEVPGALALLLPFFAATAHALQFSPAGPIGQSAYPLVTAVAVSASAQQVDYAAAGGRLFRSWDAGERWTTLAVPSSTIEQITVDPTNSANRLHRWAEARLPFRRQRPDLVHFVISTNAGSSWSRLLAQGLPPGGQQLAIDPATRRLFSPANPSAFT